MQRLALLILLTVFAVGCGSSNTIEPPDGPVETPQEEMSKENNTYVAPE